MQIHVNPAGSDGNLVVSLRDLLLPPHSIERATV